MKNKFIYVPILMILMLSAGFLWIDSEHGVVYIDNQKLFEGFELKQHLERNLKQVEEKRKVTIDSLKLVYDGWTKKLDSIPSQGKDAAMLLIKVRQFEDHIRMKEAEITRKNELDAREASDQVWKQLNQYVADFGEAKGYDIVFGTSGNGNIMYGKKSMDKTAEVIIYVNEKYKGKK